jgi:signal transduction histidine kinase
MSRRILTWLLIVVAWLAFAALETTFNYSFAKSSGMSATWWSIGRRLFVAYLLWGAILTPLVLWFCALLPIDRQNWKVRVPVHALAMIGAAASNALLRLPFHHFVYPNAPGHVCLKMFGNYFLANFPDDVVNYSMVAVIYHVVRYYRHYRDRELRASLLQVQLTRAQLETLRAQLQPHFLFNTLHAISALMHENIHAADSMLARLSDLLRMTLENGEVQEVSLKSELDFVEGYLDIERTRFLDRLNVVWHVAPDALDCAIPNMLLQPLVENAVRHGIARKSTPGTIIISAERRDGWLDLRVSDDGPGLEPEAAGPGPTPAAAWPIRALACTPSTAPPTASKCNPVQKRAWKLRCLSPSSC